MTHDCENCPVHAATVKLHAVAKYVAGTAINKRRGRFRADATANRDELRHAVAEFERASEKVLNLRFGWPPPESHHPNPDAEMRR